MNYRHTPVLMTELIEGLNIKKGNRYIDATLGGAGHTEEIIGRGGIVLGIDADGEAVENAILKLGNLPKGSIKLVQGNFRDIFRLASDNGFGQVDGIIFDLGISSYQIDKPERGFSYKFTDGTLDMRFDQGQQMRAWDIINNAQKEELYEIFSKYGEEKYSRSIADSVYSARKMKKINTTGELLEAINPVFNGKNVPVDALSRIYQSLRISVNNELYNLRKALEDIDNLLVTKGRVGIISYHSLEDRIVKLWSMGPGWIQVNKKPIKPGFKEVNENRRSRSAKLRIIEKA